jgi:hypothetical protein
MALLACTSTRSSLTNKHLLHTPHASFAITQTALAYAT